MGIHVNNSLQATTKKKRIFLQCPIPWPKIDNQNDQKYILSVYMLRIRQSVTEHITATTPQSTIHTCKKARTDSHIMLSHALYTFIHCGGGRSLNMRKRNSFCPTAWPPHFPFHAKKNLHLNLFRMGFVYQFGPSEVWRVLPLATSQSLATYPDRGVNVQCAKSWIAHIMNYFHGIISFRFKLNLPFRFSNGRICDVKIVCVTTLRKYSVPKWGLCALSFHAYGRDWFGTISGGVKWDEIQVSSNDTKSPFASLMYCVHRYAPVVLYKVAKCRIHRWYCVFWNNCHGNKIVFGYQLMLYYVSVSIVKYIPLRSSVRQIIVHLGQDKHH